ncbi:hypothetical protein R0J87_15400 [Halomonas sp. SIMBA_159]
MKAIMDSDRLLAGIMQGLPVSLVSDLGAYQGRRYAQKALKRRALWVERLYHNLEFLYERSLDESERWLLLKAYAEQLGRVYAEISVLPKLVDHPALNIINQDILDAVEGPFLTVMPHLANWETVFILLRRLAKPQCVLYEPRETETRMKLAMRSRQTLMPLAKFVSTSQAQPMRALSKTLEQGGGVLMVPDAPGSKGLIPAFGKSPLTQGNRWLAAKLAANHGARVVPVCVTRLEGANMSLTVHPPLPIDAKLTPREQALCYAEGMDNLFETWVRQSPTDWYWLKDVKLYI